VVCDILAVVTARFRLFYVFVMIEDGAGCCSGGLSKLFEAARGRKPNRATAEDTVLLGQP